MRGQVISSTPKLLYILAQLEWRNSSAMAERLRDADACFTSIRKIVKIAFLNFELAVGDFEGNVTM